MKKKEYRNMKTTDPPVKDSINYSPLWRSFILIPLTVYCVAVSPAPKAFGVNPPPDGGYPGNNAEGTNALLNLTSGMNNTAVGNNGLRDNTTGGSNVAVGSGALASNIDGNFNMAIGTEALRGQQRQLQPGHWFPSGLHEHHRQPSHRNWRCSAQEQHQWQF